MWKPKQTVLKGGEKSLPDFTKELNAILDRSDMVRMKTPIKWGLSLPHANAKNRRANVLANGFLPYPWLEVGEEKSGPIAVAGFGPSLGDTLDDIRQFDVISTSGAHDFLIANGIIPKGHVEVDGRAHKAKFLHNPHKNVTYYIATGCHPDVFKALEGYNVVKWNLFTWDDLGDDFYRETFGDTFSLDVGCAVGNAAMIIAGVLGYRDFHIFGMDCSYKGTERHAGAHHGPMQLPLSVTLGAEKFLTTAQMVAAAQDFWVTIARMGGPNFQIYGEGMLQAWVDNVIERNAHV